MCEDAFDYLWKKKKKKTKKEINQIINASFCNKRAKKYRVTKHGEETREIFTREKHEIIIF